MRIDAIVCHDKVLSKCFKAVLSHTCIWSTRILEKSLTTRANMTAISISVYDIGLRRCAGLTSAVRNHYFIWIPCRDGHVFFRILNTFITSLHSRSREQGASVIYFYRSEVLVYSEQIPFQRASINILNDLKEFFKSRT